MSRRRTLIALALAVPVALGTAGLSAGAAHAQKPRYKPAFASLLGANEIGEDGSRNAGDDDGEGSFALSAGATNICYSYVVKAIDQPTLAHIHKAKAGKNGDPVVTLQIPDTGDPGLVSECLQNQDEALVEDIIEHPQKYYVNVHTTAFPDGAIRGQLQRLPKNQ
jgi:hypothetical protein